MNSNIGPRHASSARQHRTAHRRKSAPPEAKVVEPSASKLFTFTIDADTADVVKFEVLDQSGTRREPSEEEKATLMREARAGALEEVLARAFEAGITCALGDDLAGSAEREESDEEKTLRRLLLERLIEHSDMKGALQRDALGRLILESLIQHSIHEPPSTAGQSTGTADRTAQARTN